MRASVHVVTRDRNDCLAILLSSLLEQTNKEFDIVILENSEHQLIQQHPLCSIILMRLQYEGHRVHIERAEPTIKDIGVLRNMVIDKDPFKNKVGIRIDDDSYCEKNYIEILTKPFEFEKNNQPIGVVGGIVPYMHYEKVYRLPPAKFNMVTEDFDWSDDCIHFYNTPIDKYFEAGHARSSYAYDIDLAKKIRFPEWTGATGFSEETIFCIKAWMNGYKVLFNPNAVCWHILVSYGGGRGTIQTQQEVQELVANAKTRLKKELAEYRQSLNLEARCYP